MKNAAPTSQPSLLIIYRSVKEPNIARLPSKRSAEKRDLVLKRKIVPENTNY